VKVFLLQILLLIFDVIFLHLQKLQLLVQLLHTPQGQPTGSTQPPTLYGITAICVRTVLAKLTETVEKSKTKVGGAPYHTWVPWARSSMELPTPGMVLVNWQSLS